MGTGFPPIAELLPHRGPAVWLDTVLEDSEDRIRTSAHIMREHPLFVPGSGVPVWAGIELMAQAVAAHAGMQSRRSGQPPRKGMLLGTRRYQAQADYFSEGAPLEIVAEREFGSNSGLGACNCKILHAGKILAIATIIIIEISEEMIR